MEAPGLATIDAAFTGDDPEDLTAFGNGVIYQARVFATHGEELYYTDGTESGSGLVRDIRPGRRLPGGELDRVGDVGLPSETEWAREGVPSRNRLPAPALVSARDTP